MSEAVFDPNQQIIVPGLNNDLDLISDDIYYCMLDSKNFVDFTRYPWYMKMMKSNELLKDIKPENAKKKIKVVLD